MNNFSGIDFSNLINTLFFARLMNWAQLYIGAGSKIPVIKSTD